MSIGPRVDFQELHRLLTHAANLRSEIDRAPKMLQLHKDKLAKQELDLKDFLDSTRKAKVHQSEKEGALKDLNQKIDKWEGQINSVNSKKEFDALKHETANAKAQCKKIEDEILELMTDVKAVVAPTSARKGAGRGEDQDAQLIDDIQTRRTSSQRSSPACTSRSRRWKRV